MKQEIELKLYIIEKSASYFDVVSKLYLLLDSQFNDGYKLDVIDILKNPEKTIEDGILASPTLIRVKPLPPKRIVGHLLIRDLIEELELKDSDYHT
jgi:circadian clock protein KaiB